MTCWTLSYLYTATEIYLPGRSRWINMFLLISRVFGWADTILHVQNTTLKSLHINEIILFKNKTQMM